MNSVRLTENAIPTIFFKQRDAKPKRINSLMEKLNRKRVCLSDNRVILGANYWTFTSSLICEYVNLHFFNKTLKFTYAHSKLTMAVHCRHY